MFKVLAATAAGLSLLGLLSALGGVSRTLDLLNHVTPMFLAGGVLAASLGLTCLSLTRPSLTRLSLRRLDLTHLGPVGRATLLLLGLGSILATAPRILTEWRAAPPRTARATPGALTVLTQNVWDANPDPHATAKTLAARGADIVILQELQTDQARIVARDLERQYPYAADCTLVTRWCSLAILSRLPIRSWSYHQGGWKPPKWDRLVLVQAEIDSPNLGRFEVIGTKLTHPYTGDLQQGQIERLIGKVRAFPLDRTILVGDFNLTPWSFALRRIDRTIGLERRTRGLATWPNRFPSPRHPLALPFAILPIDQVYAGSAWRTVAADRGPRTASDHYGVLVTLSPAATPQTTAR